MSEVNAPLLALNRGEVSQQALARVDAERLRLAAETQVNIQPTVLGSASLRPGLAMVGEIVNDDVARMLPFVRGFDETALIEVTRNYLRVWIEDEVLTRNSTGTQLVNPTFAASTGWTTTGTTSGCTASIASGVLTLTATARGGLAQAKQTITVQAQDQNVEHAITIVVTKGPVTVRMGTTDGGRDLIAQTDLEEGTHSLAFTPTGGSAYLQIESTDRRSKKVTKAQIEGGADPLMLPSPWAEADLPYLRHDQSGDVMYVGCNGRQQYKIERRSDRSWSIVKFLCNDGPFEILPSSAAILTPGAYYGDTTLTSDLPFFQESHVGALFRLFTSGQKRQAVLGAADAATDAIRVQGIGSDRNFSWTVSGTFVGTLTLERSFDGADAGFVSVDPQTGTGTFAHTDAATFDNVECWFRVRFTAYTSGSATVVFTFTGGGGRRGHKRRADEPVQTTASGGLITAVNGGGGAGICRVTASLRRHR